MCACLAQFLQIVKQNRLELPFIPNHFSPQSREDRREGQVKGKVEKSRNQAIFFFASTSICLFLCVFCAFAVIISQGAKKWEKLSALT